MSVKQIKEVVSSTALEVTWEGRSYVFRDPQDENGHVIPGRWDIGKMAKGDYCWIGRYTIRHTSGTTTAECEGDKFEVAEWMAEQYTDEVAQHKTRMRHSLSDDVYDTPQPPPPPVAVVEAEIRDSVRAAALAGAEADARRRQARQQPQEDYGHAAIFAIVATVGGLLLTGLYNGVFW